MATLSGGAVLAGGAGATDLTMPPVVAGDVVILSWASPNPNTITPANRPKKNGTTTAIPGLTILATYSDTVGGVTVAAMIVAFTSTGDEFLIHFPDPGGGGPSTIVAVYSGGIAPIQTGAGWSLAPTASPLSTAPVGPGGGGPMYGNPSTVYAGDYTVGYGYQPALGAPDVLHTTGSLFAVVLGNCTGTFTFTGTGPVTRFSVGAGVNGDAITFADMPTGGDPGIATIVSGADITYTGTASIVSLSLGAVADIGTDPASEAGYCLSTVNDFAAAATAPTITGGTLLPNGSFETGDLTSWTTGGDYGPAIVVTTEAFDATHSCAIGTVGTSGTEPTGDSWIEQTYVVPSSPGNLVFAYWPATTDSITFDWQEAQLLDSTGTFLAQIFKDCRNDQAWVGVSFDLTPYAGQTVKFRFNVHQDGAGDLTYMYLDDIRVGATLTPGSPAVRGIANHGMAFSPAGDYLYCLHIEDDPAPSSIARIHTATWTIEYSWAAISSGGVLSNSGLAVDPSGHIYFFGNTGSGWEVWKIDSTGALVAGPWASFPAGFNAARSLIYCDDGNLHCLATTSGGVWTVFQITLAGAVTEISALRATTNALSYQAVTVDAAGVVTVTMFPGAAYDANNYARVYDPGAGSVTDHPFQPVPYPFADGGLNDRNSVWTDPAGDVTIPMVSFEDQAGIIKPSLVGVSVSAAPGSVTNTSVPVPAGAQPGDWLIVLALFCISGTDAFAGDPNDTVIIAHDITKNGGTVLPSPWSTALDGSVTGAGHTASFRSSGDPGGVGVRGKINAYPVVGDEVTIDVPWGVEYTFGDSDPFAHGTTIQAAGVVIVVRGATGMNVPGGNGWFANDQAASSPITEPDATSGSFTFPTHMLPFSVFYGDMPGLIVPDRTPAAQLTGTGPGGGTTPAMTIMAYPDVTEPIAGLPTVTYTVPGGGNRLGFGTIFAGNDSTAVTRPDISWFLKFRPATGVATLIAGTWSYDGSPPPVSTASDIADGPLGVSLACETNIGNGNTQARSPDKATVWFIDAGNSNLLRKLALCAVAGNWTVGAVRFRT